MTQESMPLRHLREGRALKGVCDQGDGLVVLIVGDLHRGVVGQPVAEVNELTEIRPRGLMKPESDGNTRILGKCCVAHNRILPRNRHSGKASPTRPVMFVSNRRQQQAFHSAARKAVKGDERGY